ncbi:unnamed protein product [Linum trigynum]|uniref:Uncharacterized protein n=1 Tax=Linum trigynum TaxID=586398 RepID=A0AAV2FQC9_9ROSI
MGVLAIWQELRRPLVRPHLMKLLVSVLTLHGVQVFSGIDLLTSESLAFPRDKPSFEALDYLLEQLPPLCRRLFPILVPIFISDVVGRGQLLRYNLAGVASSMVFINVSSTLLKNVVRSRGIKLMYKVSMSAFFGSYSFGFGSVTMIHTTEALPFKVRAQVIGITVMVNRLVSFILYYVKTATDTSVVDVWY